MLREREIMNEHDMYFFYNVHVCAKKKSKTHHKTANVCVCVAVVFANFICKHARKCPRLRQRVWQIFLASRIWDAMLLSNDLSSFM